MQALRRSKFLAILVLAWWVLFMGIAAATPWVSPDASQMVCSAGGTVKWVNPGAEEDSTSTAMGMDCPLCATVAPLAMPPAMALAAPDGLAHALRPTVAAHIAALTAPPLPSRGPPL